MRRAFTQLHTLVLATLLATLLTLVPTSAWAVTQAEVDAAQAELDQLTIAYEQAAGELAQTRTSLDESRGEMDRLEGKVAETTEEFDQAQDNLREYTRGRYKQGTLRIIQAVFSSKTFEELVSNIHYARSVEAYGVEMVQRVNTIREELEQEQDDLLMTIQKQDELLMQQESQLSDLDSAQAAQQSYLDGLSQELLAQIELERARAAEEEARRIEEEKAKEEAEAKAKEEEAAKEAEQTATEDAAEQTGDQKQADEQDKDDQKQQDAQGEGDQKQEQDAEKKDEKKDTAQNNSGGGNSKTLQEQVVPLAPVLDQGDVVTGEDIARLAVQIAPTVAPEGRIQVATPHTRPTDKRCAAYLAVHDAVWERVFKNRYSWNYPYYASCAPAVLKVVQYSNADTDFDVLPSGTQYIYFRNSPLWEEIKVKGNPSFDDICEPGDVITRPGHTMLYVGNKIVREYYPKSDGGMWQAAETARLLPGVTGGQGGGAAGWYIFRLIPHTNPHVY